MDLMEPQVLSSETPPPHGFSPSVPQAPAQKTATGSNWTNSQSVTPMKPMGLATGHIRPPDEGTSQPNPTTAERTYWHAAQVPAKESPGWTMSEIRKSNPHGVKAQLPQESGQVSPTVAPVIPYKS